nr:hypothetical protein [Tanacetum cinerariifolium]
MEDQPLPADASPTTLSPSYIVDSDPEKDEKDPKEDPADYPADRGDNDDDESSNDEDNDDDVEKDKEDKEDEEHLAPADPSDKMAPKKAAPKRTTTVTNTQLQAMIDQGVNAVLAARDANRTSDDNHTSRTDVRRTERVTRECTYQDFMKCQPLYFKGTKGVIELTQWFER